MRLLRLILRLIGVLLMILSGCLQAAFFFPREGVAGRQRRVQRWSQQCLRLFGIRLQVEGAERFFAEGGRFMIGNHVSWLDIFVVNAVQPVRFVAKEEVRRWPLMGWLAARAQTVFIKRGSRSSSERVREVLLQILAEDDYAVVFPEGTSTDGFQIKPFKINMFETAVQSGRAVWPLLVYYPDVDGQPKRRLAYYGDEMSLWDSFCAIFPEREHEARLYFLNPIEPAGLTRQQIGALAQEAVAQKLAQLRGCAPEEVVAEEGVQFARTD